MKRVTRLLAVMTLTAVAAVASAAEQPNPRVRLTTNLGAIELELDAKAAPETVRNFTGYVESGHYHGTIFHRVIPGFMIQGGGFAPGMKEKATRAPIRNEAANGLKNLTGTVAMARTPDPHSASAQFFINVVDNDSLNHTGRTREGWGYAVFGKVTRGMEVVRKIEGVRTKSYGPHGDVPVEDVVITRAELIKK